MEQGAGEGKKASGGSEMSVAEGVPTKSKASGGSEMSVAEGVPTKSKAPGGGGMYKAGNKLTSSSQNSFGFSDICLFLSRRYIRLAVSS